MNVLIVDDIATNRKLLRALLEAEGLTVFVLARRRRRGLRSLCDWRINRNTSCSLFAFTTVAKPLFSEAFIRCSRKSRTDRAS